jgi:predicted nucleic acid-binding protein
VIRMLLDAQELIRTYSDPYYRRFVTPEQVDCFEFLLRRDAVMTELIVPVLGVATQPKDDLILSTGISAGATYLATRDRQLLKLGSYQGMQISSICLCKRVIRSRNHDRRDHV